MDRTLSTVADLAAAAPPMAAGRCFNGLNHTLDLDAQLATGGGASACCPSACGQCGGANCEAAPGGALECCIYGLVAANETCTDDASVACIVPNLASEMVHPTPTPTPTPTPAPSLSP